LIISLTRCRSEDKVFAKHPRLDPELEDEPNSALTLELLIYYIGKF
jgi:hypothetical protein